MQDRQLIGLEGARRVSTAFVIAELNFKDAGRESLHHRTHLPALQAARWEIL